MKFIYAVLITLVIAAPFASGVQWRDTYEQVAVDMSDDRKRFSAWQWNDVEADRRGVEAMEANTVEMKRVADCLVRLEETFRAFLPLLGEAPPPSALDVNTATLAELLTIEGMALWTGLRIINNRPYLEVADLVDLDGITASMVEAWIRDNKLEVR